MVGNGMMKVAAMLIPVLFLIFAQTPAPAQAPGAAPAAGQADSGPELLQIRSVYLMPMANSFDQYLAHHVARLGIFQVVTDPAKADAILADRIGKAFEKAFAELYPEPAPPEAPKEEKEETEDPSKSVTLDVKSVPMDRNSSFGRGKGAIFLVRRASRNVVWSTYARPKRTLPDNLNDTAGRVAGQLASAVKHASKTSR